MPDSLRSSIDRRRYRLAQATVLGGSLAGGLLILGNLVAAFREDFFLYYGVDQGEFTHAQQQADAALPLTVWQLMIAAMALVWVVAFIGSERRRARQAGLLRSACRGRCRELLIARPSISTLFDTFVLRTSIFAGVLLSMWLLQTCLERSLGGLGWGVEYANWRSVLPIVSVFGLCVLVGMLVAAVSLVGLRAIHVLEVVLRAGHVRSIKAYRVWRTRMRQRCELRTIRELMGCDVLSRPPPAVC